jgi:nitrate reductase gamma subunit
MSSQILENRMLFWGSVPWHYGIIPILLAHLFSGLFPGAAVDILRGHWRLFVLEPAGISLGFFTILGIVALILRRLRRSSPVHGTTSIMDGVLLAVLLAQVITGVSTAIFHRWGSLWYLNTATPWFWSIVGLSPDSGKVATLPGIVKFHMVNGFIVILLFPFTRLVHVFTVPLDYLWRAYQIVIWNRRTWRAPGSAEAAR